MLALTHRLNRTRLRPYLEQCGYQRGLMESNVPLPDNGRTALAAFAYAPRDSRSACIAAIDGFTDPHQEAVACRALGAPVIFVCLPDQLQWWETGTEKTVIRESVPTEYVSNFFEQHRNTFAPDTIYRAKTIGRFDPSCQLEFVDVGLMPLLEAQAGRKLVDLLVRVVQSAKNRLRWSNMSEQEGHWLLKAHFWLLAAKILKDKDVHSFSNLELSDLKTVYERLREHYGASDPVPIDTKAKHEALSCSAREIAQFGHLGLVSTEALAYLYENALITKETRAELGTHSTPTYLVDYIIGRLRPWISEISWKQQRVFEPACGHAAFMLAAMRVLGELLPDYMSVPNTRHQYLRHRLHGCDYDPFALEIARLSLTLADVPNPNGWNLHTANIFDKDILADGAREASLILANPPFENFSTKERAHLEKQGAILEFNSKAAEMLWRVASNMRPSAVLGVVLPQGALQSKNATSLRRFLAKEFEILEVCLFPDKIFTFSDAESAVLLARRLDPSRPRTNTITYRRVRESDVKEFTQTFRPTSETHVRHSDLFASQECDFFVPELADVWKSCRTYPRLSSIADVGQGLFFRSHKDPLFPKGAVTESPRRKKGFIQGFVGLRETLQTHLLPDPLWLNLDQRVIDRTVRGATQGISQVLLNYAPVSRGPWRLKAFLDRKGHPVTSRFLAVRPIDKTLPLEFLWALLNSPIANAYSYAFSGKRDILAGLMRDLPVPRLANADLHPLITAVRSYFKAAKVARDGEVDAVHREALRVLHLRIDAEVLRLYHLPVQCEHQILLLFCRDIRRGVPFSQTEYLPKGFVDRISLEDLLAITEDWERTGRLRTRLILKEERKNINELEKVELEHLQHLTDVRIRLIAPLPLAELERMATDLRRRGLWVENKT